MLEYLKNFIKKSIKVLAPLIFIFLCSYLMYKGSGANINNKNIIIMTIFLVFLSSSRKSFFFIVIPFVLLFFIYAPIGLTFGEISYKYIASVFSTDVVEANEFISQIPIVNWFYAILIPISLCIFRYLSKKYNINYLKNKTFIIISILVITYNQSPFYFIKKVYSSTTDVVSELKKLNEYKVHNAWGKSTLNDKSKYNTYVLVIGESVRRDYMGVYGYPINNTPFLSKVNGVVINGLESAGTNTVASLRLMLTQGNINKWTPEYNYNIIDLAKSAGYKTYWLSNQGYTGTYDTPVTAIAKQSDNRYFLKLGAYNSSNTSDYALLPEIKTTISNKIKKKLIVIHLYGSHPSACDRITDFDKIITVKDKKYKYLSCYVNSIAKTDDFLSQVYSMLEDEYQKNKNDTFSMIYFSDHGLSHRLVDGQILFNNNKVSKYHFDVPLIKMSSDDYQHDEYNVSKSGAFFTDGLASWLGINNEKISNRYDLFSNESDKEISHYRVKLDEYKNDPAINIDNL